MLKSGEKGLIGPGSNNYGKDDKLVKELTPELADKIWNSVQKKLHEQRIAKEHVLHHLKQLKAEMGRKKMKTEGPAPITVDAYNEAIEVCMKAIDKKIEKVNKL